MAGAPFTSRPAAPPLVAAPAHPNMATAACHPGGWPFAYAPQHRTWRQTGSNRWDISATPRRAPSAGFFLPSKWQAILGGRGGDCVGLSPGRQGNGRVESAAAAAHGAAAEDGVVVRPAPAGPHWRAHDHL